MRNTFGQAVSVTLFGESHGEGIGAVIDGLCAGLEVDLDFIASQLSKRRPSGKTDTPRVEKDNFKILSGVFCGKTTGTPIAIFIPNENTKSGDYSYGVARPSHADFVAHEKYHGFEDYRGGGHFSGRVTVALVAVGAIMLSALKGLGIKIGTHILSCAGIYDREFESYESDIDLLSSKTFPTLNPIENEISDKIFEIGKDGDSVGGKVQTAIIGMPIGVGEPWFDSVESVISHAVFSIGGIKGIEFGAGFSFSSMLGSEANDQIRIENGKVITTTNNNGGINGGISNSMPITFNCAVKPTPSISKKQHTIDFVKNENIDAEIKGRHDPAIIRRICVVLNSVTAIALCDLLATKYGTDVFLKGLN